MKPEVTDSLGCFGGYFFLRGEDVCLLVAQLVKNPPAMWETWVQSLG